MIFFLIRWKARRKKKRVSIAVTLLELSLITLFIIRGFAYYEVVITGGSFSDSQFINPVFANQREGHFYSLYTKSSGGLEEPYRGLYRAYEKGEALKAFLENKIPFSNDTLVDEIDSTNAYVEMISLSVRAPKSIRSSQINSNQELLQEAELNSVLVAEVLLGKQLPEDVLAIDTSTFGGGSAGLMLALELIQQFGDHDILKGYSICGTGTINKNGEVGSIGGLRMKLLSAEKDKFDYCFVPQKDYRAALRYAKEGHLSIHIIPVSASYNSKVGD